MPELPLEKRTVALQGVNGLNKEVAAISEVWKQDRIWCPYLPPPDPAELRITGAEDAWLQRGELVAADLVWLLRLSAHKFWSQIQFDSNLQKNLEGLLQHYPREYDAGPSSELIDKLNNSILHKLFLVLLRLCTYKESATDFFSPEYYGDLIYHKFIIDLPKIIDMCALFRSCNEEILAKMIGNVFKVQPKYMEDLLITGETLCKAFENANEQYQSLSMSLPSAGNLDGFIDLVGFVIDISSSTYSLLDVFPAASSSLHIIAFETRLATFYHSTIVELQQMLDKYIAANIISNQDAVRVCRLIQLSRHRSILAFRSIIQTTCLDHILQNQQAAAAGGHVNLNAILEDFLAIYTTVLQERTFLLDYNAKFSIREDFELFEQSEAVTVDPTRKHYILDALCASTAHEEFVDPHPGGRGEKEKPSSALGAEATSKPSAAGPGSMRPSIEVDSMISNVRDMLPYLGEGFVLKCLEHYQYKVEEVVNAILECNLAPHLAEMDQNLPREEKEKEAAAVSEPRSVYDYDEFDINTRDDIDMSRIHRGKKNKIGDANKFLDDKSDIHGMRDRFSKLGLVSDIEVLVGSEGEYEDEYDDTYDEVNVGAEEPDSRDDGVQGRKFVLPVALGGGKIARNQKNYNDDDEDEDDDEEVTPGGKKMNFARNPEEMRAEADRRRQEKMNRNTKKQGGHQQQPAASKQGQQAGGGKPGPQHQAGGAGVVPPHRDVVGRAKGQGQDKQVLINRARKNQNKNKGQRVGADRKQAKGMF